jgi:hypothetical protein
MKSLYQLHAEYIPSGTNSSGAGEKTRIDLLAKEVEQIKTYAKMRVVTAIRVHDRKHFESLLKVIGNRSSGIIYMTVKQRNSCKEILEIKNGKN